MEITKKETALIEEWIELHREMEKLEDELDTISKKLRQISNKLYARNPRIELEMFRDYLAGEIKRLNKKADKDRIKELSSLKTIVEHDINIDNLVEQDIDIEEKGIKIDLKDYKYNWEKSKSPKEHTFHKAASYSEAAFSCKKFSDSKIRILRIDIAGPNWQNAS